MLRKLLGLIAFVLTGAGLMMQTLTKGINSINISFLVIIGCFFTISLFDHYKELKS